MEKKPIINLLKKSLTLSRQKMIGMKLHDEDLVSHNIMVAQILEMLDSKKETVAAGYLHHILERSNTMYAELLLKCGVDVADFCVELTPIEHNTYPMLHTFNAKLVLFCCRLVSMAHAKNWSDKKRNEYLTSNKFWKDFNTMQEKKHE